MELSIHLFILLPVLGFLISLLIPAKKEELISKVAFTTVGLSLLSSMVFIGLWLVKGLPDLNIRDFSLYKSINYDFFIDFYFDKVSAVYLLVGAVLTFLVTVYSRYYLHRESGYKRFFNTILFFYTGYNITVLAGNFETLFIGWEILGISSFLLIAFYRQRYLPVKNAIKVFTIYRIGDVGILLAMWMSHHLWHENITFQKLANYELVHHYLQAHSSIGIFISLMILIAAAAKSAQLPFSAWLPRAMEGPTPSSAIFYGSLSVHIGAFLLLRTFPFWEHQLLIRWLIAGVGLLTALAASLIARVQSTVKSQIAYASAAQIGIIFMEIAAGWDILALVHFAGNAFLRTYQLLISPSVVTYLIREQFYNYTPRKQTIESAFGKRLRYALYLLSIKEWHLDSVIFTFFFSPLKKIRRAINFLTLRNVLFFFVPLYVLGLSFAYTQQHLSQEIKDVLAPVVAFLALLMVAKAYNERSSSRLAWLLIVLAHFFVDLSISFNDEFNLKEAAVYLSGVVISGIVGYICLHEVKAFEHHGIGLNQFHGLIRRYRSIAFVFLLCCLGLAGFPITTTFFGEDIILTHIHENQVLLAFLVALTFIINGIAVIRIYARVFLGANSRSFLTQSDLTA
ncbi:proton-conducting transporter membrane subunit [Cesiribacter sp. SM1]|uniref:proton-conducting transporter transmembrane domain-containing protein n=1 Tax=Cesiribacter sp. SM1 TaxID=2861196 RepID=UPI001CD4B992|nr:proton-conducting transporter membrane subunit [Cesiribacter sp. SM1]